jgi:hypothetical protein
MSYSNFQEVDSGILQCCCRMSKREKADGRIVSSQDMGLFRHREPLRQKLTAVAER